MGKTEEPKIATLGSIKSEDDAAIVTTKEEQ